MRRPTRTHSGLQFGLLIALLCGIGLTAGRFLHGCVEDGSTRAVVQVQAGHPEAAADRSWHAGSPPPPGAGDATDGGVAHESSAPGASPGVGPMPVVHARDPEEWQAMLVDLTFRQVCSESSVCGLALACKEDGFCGPCSSDGECAVGEICVLDHCLLRDNTTCRSRLDCAAGELCTLTDYSQGRRANAELRSRCLGRTGGEEQTPERADPPQWQPAPPTPVRVDTLMESLRETSR